MSDNGVLRIFRQKREGKLDVGERYIKRSFRMLVPPDIFTGMRLNSVRWARHIACMTRMRNASKMSP
jgi:hypothetical protein